MRSAVETITPEMAKELLANSGEFQRKIRDAVVDRYARDMREGEWKITHQGIAFDCKGRLIDGQHRLAAIIKADMPIKMLVTRDAPSVAFDHVDIGFGRTYVDVFRLRGEGWISQDHIAMARMIEYGHDDVLININRSPFELRDLVNKHKTAIEFVLSNVEHRVRGITVAGVMAAIALAWYNEKDRIKLAEFIRILVSGVAQDPIRDEIVIRFREMVKESVGISFGSKGRQEVFFKTQRVVKAFMRDERLTKFYTPSAPVYRAKTSRQE